MIEPIVFGDDRVCFFESFNEKDFAAVVSEEVGLVLAEHSVSTKGMLRGPHCQMERAQDQLVRVYREAAFDVAADLN